MAEIESLPLFPLSDVVLFPQVSVPLYIFEPRYRQMTRDALDGDRQIGMVTVRPEGVDDMAGQPPIFEIGCVGRIAHAQARPDGTYQIMLLGEHRFRVLREAPVDGERLYRRAHVELLSDQPPADELARERVKQKRRELLALLEQLVRRVDSTRDSSEATQAFARLDADRLVNALARSIAFSPVERQQLLEADSVLGRFEIMSHLLRFRIAEVASAGSGSTPLPN